MNSLKLLHKPKYWLLGIAVSLIAIHLTLVGKTAPTFFLGTSVLFWAAIASRIWEKRHNFTISSNVFSRCFGTTLLGLVLLKSLSLAEYDPFLRLSPLLSALGLGLIAFGLKELKQHWQELLLLLVLAVPTELLYEPLNQLIHLPKFTAIFSSLVLWYLGFNVSLQGETIILPTGSLFVGPECSGIVTQLWLLQLAMLLVVIFPLNWIQKILVPVVAVTTGFVVNGFRIAKLAVFAASNIEAFHYWHSERAQIFSMLSVLIVGLFCLLIIRQEETEDEQDVERNSSC